MTKEQLRNLHNYLYLKYRNEMSIEFKNGDGEYYSYIISRVVTLPIAIKKEQTEWSLFAFLHEIGHVKTNTPKMKRCVQEYLATQWAIDEAKRIRFSVPKDILDVYQKYIWDWRNTSIKHKGKNVPTAESLLLNI